MTAIASTTNELVLEIRYKENPLMLDYRGAWAQQLSHSLEMPNWKVIENRVDVRDALETRQAFVSFTNMGEAKNLKLKLVREGPNWKIDDIIDGGVSLHDTLMKVAEAAG